MNNIFSLQQIQKTSNLDADLISRQYKLNLMADLMRVKYENPKLKQRNSKSIRYVFFDFAKISKRYKYAFTI